VFGKKTDTGGRFHAFSTGPRRRGKEVIDQAALEEAGPKGSPHLNKKKSASHWEIGIIFEDYNAKKTVLRTFRSIGERGEGPGGKSNIRY